MVGANHSPLRRTVYAAMFGALTAVSAFMVIPLQPLPITLQTLFTSLAAILLGGYTGAFSQIIYVLLGIIGLPVFAGGKAGIGILFGPSGGYLIGFIVGAYVIGKIVESRRNPGLAWIVFALLAGHLVIYTLGSIQLSIVTHFTLLEALMVGVVPFLIGDLLKLFTAAWIALKLRQDISL